MRSWRWYIHLYGYLENSTRYEWKFAAKSGSYKIKMSVYIKNYDSYFWYQKPYQDDKYQTLSFL